MIHPNSDDSTDYDVDGVYTAQELADDIMRIITQFSKESPQAALQMIREHLDDCALIEHDFNPAPKNDGF